MSKFFQQNNTPAQPTEQTNGVAKKETKPDTET